MWWGEVLHYTGMGKVGDPKTSSYKLDKIIWFICSGIFYLNDISVGRRFYTICFKGGVILEELKKTVCQEIRYEGLYNTKRLLILVLERIIAYDKMHFEVRFLDGTMKRIAISE